MQSYEWINYALAIVTGLVTAIPLAIQLVKYVKQAFQEKNWKNLLALTVDLMEDAEGMFDKGVDRKAWVMSMIQDSAKAINYELDDESTSKMIDNLCSMTKLINVTKTEAK